MVNLLHGERTGFQKTVLGKLASFMQKNEVGLKNINSKWIIDPNVKAKIIKLLE